MHQLRPVSETTCTTDASVFTYCLTKGYNQGSMSKDDDCLDPIVLLLYLVDQFVCEQPTASMELIDGLSGRGNRQELAIGPVHVGR